MHQQQVLQVPELGDGKVAAHDGLHALLSADTHPCMPHACQCCT